MIATALTVPGDSRLKTSGNALRAADSTFQGVVNRPSPGAPAVPAARRPYTFTHQLGSRAATTIITPPYRFVWQVTGHIDSSTAPTPWWRCSITRAPRGWTTSPRPAAGHRHKRADRLAVAFAQYIGRALTRRDPEAAAVPPLAPGATTGDPIRAFVFLVLTFVVAAVVNRVMEDHGGGITRAISRKLPAADETRLRVARRLVVAAIVFVGVVWALIKLPASAPGQPPARFGRYHRADRRVCGALGAGQPRLGHHRRPGPARAHRRLRGHRRVAGHGRRGAPAVQLLHTRRRQQPDRHSQRAARQPGGAQLHHRRRSERGGGRLRRASLGRARRRGPRRASRRPRPSAAAAPPSATRRSPWTELGADTVHLQLTVWQDSKPEADRAAAGLRFALDERLKAAGLGPVGVLLVPAPCARTYLRKAT